MGKQLSKTKIYTRIPEDLEEEFKMRCLRLKIKHTDAAERAIAAWLEGNRANRSEWHRKLTAILESKDEDTKNAITQNIDVFFDRLRPDGRKR